MRAAVAISTLSLQEKLAQGSPLWPQLTSSFENRIVFAPVLAEAIYNGQSHCAWMNGTRSRANFLKAQHIAIDLDELSEWKDIFTPFTMAYGTIVHSTPSHTEQEPRGRVIFFLDEPVEDAAEFEHLMGFLRVMLGGDPSCKDASRFMYGSYQAAHMKVLTGHLPLAILRQLAGPMPKQAPPPPPRPLVQPTGEDELARAIKALNRIDPHSVSYNIWVGIMAAMKRNFGDAAREAVVEWAQGKPGEVETEWDKRLREDSVRAMNLGTIFYLARRP